MKIAITGATGFIGKYLVEDLFTTGTRLVLLGRSLDKLKLTFGDRAKAIEFDQVEYTENLDKYIKNVDTIVHLAGLRYWQNKSLQNYLKDNVIAIDKLLASAVVRQVKHVVFASSISVYSPKFNTIPYTENQLCFPTTHYGVSKLICEKVAAYYAENFDIKITSLRIGQVLGGGEREGFMLSTMFERARSKQPIIIWGNGDGARDYIYVKDVVGAIKKAIEPDAPGGIFNIGGDKAVSHLEMAEAINWVFENEGNIIFDSTKPEDRNISLMDSSKAKMELNWFREWTLEMGLQEIKRLYEKG